MAKDDFDVEDEDDKSEEAGVISEQFGEYTCPHCGKPIQVVLTVPVDDEDDDEEDDTDEDEGF